MFSKNKISIEESTLKVEISAIPMSIERCSFMDSVALVKLILFK